MTNTIESDKGDDRHQISTDAGLRESNHYASKLSRWRYSARQWLLPRLRAETPYLAFLQESLRSPALDGYFAFTANLGTHTFYMIILPILFWCGLPELGRAMVHILASGVFFSGFMKDFFCLPRPLSPPLQRITMSGSAALEYGFPSTHTTNAISVATYAFYALRNSERELSRIAEAVLIVLLSCYAFSIVAGRLYCGMHGFIDVIIGGLLGAILSMLQCYHGRAFDEWLHEGTYLNPLLVVFVVLVLVRIHPEPADDCPCFDDSVAFAGAIIGVELGSWHYSSLSLTSMVKSARSSDESLWWVGYGVRIVFGVSTIFAWRGLMKPILLRFLPPVFRVVEQLGLSLPRRYFIRASQYKRIPSLKKDDNVIPAVSEIPSLLMSLRQPRKRAVSIGPQSAADVYEAISYSNHRRRASLSSTKPVQPIVTVDNLPSELVTDAADGQRYATLVTEESVPSPETPNSSGSFSSHIRMYEQMMGSAGGPVRQRSERTMDGKLTTVADQDRPTMSDSESAKWHISKLEKPRVRYDVEVVTKLIVYSGIAWLTVEGNPILFDLCGLGLN